MLHIISHPLLEHKLTLLRNKYTSEKDFRELLSEISVLMCYEATKNAEISSIENTVLVPILRSGLQMSDGILELLPHSKIGHIGLYKNPQTDAPVEYYCKLPNNTSGNPAILLEPLISTGTEISTAIQYLKNHKVSNITILSIMASREAVDFILEKHTDVNIFTTNLDTLNKDDGYLYPGIGDLSLRIYGTK